MIPDANKWTYTNLTKQNRTKGWIPDANQLDLYQSPKKQNKQGCQMPIYGHTPISQGKTKHGYQMPIYLDLYQYPKQRNKDTGCQSLDLYQSPTISQETNANNWTYN
jgi:hypothetical protein